MWCTTAASTMGTGLSGATTSMGRARAPTGAGSGICALKAWPRLVTVVMVGSPLVEGSSTGSVQVASATMSAVLRASKWKCGSNRDAWVEPAPPSDQGRDQVRGLQWHPHGVDQAHYL